MCRQQSRRERNTAQFISTHLTPLDLDLYMTQALHDSGPDVDDSPGRSRFKSPKSFWISASAATFVLGAVGAVAYGFRRKPLDASRIDLPVVTRQTTRSARSLQPASASNTPPPPESDAELEKNAWEVFRDVHKAMFSSISLKRTSSRPAAKAVLVSSHTSPSAKTIGALTRSSHNPASGASHATNVTPSVLSKKTSATTQANARQIPETNGADGPLLALGAFGLATAIVGAGALAVTWAVQYALGVDTVEEFADKMHTIMPPLSRHARMAQYIPAVPVSKHQELPVSTPQPSPFHHREAEADETPVTMLSQAELTHKLEHTDDIPEWLTYARMQLDAEYAAHEAAKSDRRRQRDISTT